MQTLIRTKNQNIEQQIFADGTIVYHRLFLSSEKANLFFEKLREEVNWQQQQLRIFGKTHDIPRLTAFYGENGLGYSYSCVKHDATPWHPTLLEMKEQVEAEASCTFNVALLNLYRSGADSVGWHSDDEKELGENPIIASVSLGGPRKFQLRTTSDHSMRHEIMLEHGSLIIMKGNSQHRWQHQIPKSSEVEMARINITFRKIY